MICDLPAHWLWQGRAVKLVDGMTLSMPDTQANQNRFPQSQSQQPGVGFPIYRLVGLMCLGCGAVIDIAYGPYQGKSTGEQALFRDLLDNLQANDVLLGDALCNVSDSIYTLSTVAQFSIHKPHRLKQTQGSVNGSIASGRAAGKAQRLLIAATNPNKPAYTN